MPEVFCSDEQDEVPIDLPRWRKLALDTLSHEGVRGSCELSLYFVDRASMAELNREHMGKEGATDVLAFPLDGTELVEASGPGRASAGPARPHPDHDDMPYLLGDVVVCPAVAKEQFGDHAGTLDDELALLVVHGILHVLGHDHDEPVATAAMREREMSVLTTHHWGGPAPVAFRQEQP